MLLHPCVEERVMGSVQDRLSVEDTHLEIVAGQTRLFSSMKGWQVECLKRRVCWSYDTVNSDACILQYLAH